MQINLLLQKHTQWLLQQFVPVAVGAVLTATACFVQCHWCCTAITCVCWQ